VDAEDAQAHRFCVSTRTQLAHLLKLVDAEDAQAHRFCMSTRTQLAHLFKLVDAEDAQGVPPVRSHFFAEACGVADVPDVQSSNKDAVYKAALKMQCSLG